MSWSSRRRSIYLSGIFIFIAAVVFAFGYLYWYKPPTCFDGIRNSAEDGVDCGGSCERVCGFQAVDPIVLWSRFFEIAPGVYSATALIENPNVNKYAGPTPYTFKIRDANNILIQEINGMTDIPPERIFAIFEPGIMVSQRIPVRSSFEFDRTPDWIRSTQERPSIGVTSIKLSGEDTLPRLSATIRNDNLFSVSDIELVAIISDIEGNAITSSRTFIELLNEESSKQVVFTWPQPFSAPSVSIDIIPKIPLR